MGDRTSIAWTDATWNPVTGCTKVSPGCDHCYAERITKRFGRGAFEEVRLHPDRLEQPLRWAAPRKIFVASMGDLFHPNVPEDYLAQVFDTMASASWHTFQVLTKRPGRMASWARRMETVHNSHGTPWQWPQNVWAGTSLEMMGHGKKLLSRRLDLLAQVPAKVRFLSAEPLLGNLDLGRWLGPRCNQMEPEERQIGTVHWVIAGGESGPGPVPRIPTGCGPSETSARRLGSPSSSRDGGCGIPRYTSTRKATFAIPILTTIEAWTYSGMVLTCSA